MATPVEGAPAAGQTIADAVPQSAGSAGSCESAGVSYTGRPLQDTGFFSLPPWADSAGWANPSQYRTILGGDVDGDGNEELIGRNGSTVEVFAWAPPLPAPAVGSKEYNAVPNQWTKVIPTTGSGTAPDFSEADGWWDPSRYWTFRLARVTGRSGPGGPAMDLVYRTSTGLEVRTWSSQTSMWNAPITQSGGAWTDAAGWDQSNPQHYRSITVGDVDGNGSDEIVANGPSGVETWGYDGSTLVRRDTSAGDLVPGQFDPATWGPSTYEAMRLADLDGNGSLELVVRDPSVGLRAYSFSQGPGGLGWWEMPGAGSNDWTDAQGWWSSEAYLNISVGDLDNDGTDDLVGRSADGTAAWTYTGGAWSPMAALDARLADANGFELPQYWQTFQVADVLADADLAIPGADQVMIRSGTGMTALYLSPSDGAFPFTWEQTPLGIYAFADGYGWAPPGEPVQTHGLDDASDLYYGTIRSVRPVAGEPEVVIGRNSSGVWTTSMYPNTNVGAAGPLSGRSPSSPFPDYTNLDAIGGIALPASQPPDLGALTPAGRAYWGLDYAAGKDTWEQAPETWTIFDQFASSSATLPDSQDFRPYYTTQIQPDGTSVQVLQSPVYEPGGGVSALNVDRDTYNSVGNDMGDWTSAVASLREYIYGSDGLKALVLTAFVVNEDSVQQILPAFESNARVRALLSDLLWGIIGGLGGLAAFANPALGAVIAFAFSVTGSAVAATWGTADPNAGVEAEGTQLQNEITNAFCSANIFLDDSYEQIVADYGLLVSTDRMVERSQSASSSFSAATQHANTSLQVWIWQQFASRPPGHDVENFWVGVCRFGTIGCEWNLDDEGVWVSPENPEVSYRLVGQKSNGSEANCSWAAQHEILSGDKDSGGNQPSQAWINAFSSSQNPPAFGIGPPGAGWASPRQTAGTQSGQPLGGSGDTIAQNAGILGWDLGTARCD